MRLSTRTTVILDAGEYYHHKGEDPNLTVAEIRYSHGEPRVTLFQFRTFSTGRTTQSLNRSDVAFSTLPFFIQEALVAEVGYRDPHPEDVDPPEAYVGAGA